MVVAPAVAPPVNVTVATPEALVSAVATERVPIVGSVLNVTIALGTGAPAESVKVAFTVVKVPVEMELLASAMIIFGVPVVPPVLPVEVPAVLSLQPARTANAAANKNAAENLVVF